MRAVAVPTIKRRTDTGQQTLRIEGLIEKADRASAQCPLTNPVVGKRRNDDDWNARAQLSQSALKLNSRYSTQVYVGDQARRPVQPIRLQKLFSGRKYFGDKAKRLQQ